MAVEMARPKVEGMVHRTETSLAVDLVGPKVDQMAVETDRSKVLEKAHRTVSNLVVDLVHPKVV